MVTQTLITDLNMNKRVCKNMLIKNLSEDQRLVESRFILKFCGDTKEDAKIFNTAVTCNKT
jgi:hypothetical protein